MDSSAEQLSSPEEENKASGVHFEEREIKLEDGTAVVIPSFAIEKMDLYHGSPVSGITEFIEAEETTAGNGVYLTSDPEKARGYAIVRSKTGINPHIYTSEITNMNIANLSTKSAIRSFSQYFRQELVSWQSRFRAQRNNDLSFVDSVIDDKATDLLKLIDEDKVTCMKDIAFTFGSLVRASLAKQGFDGLMTVEGGESSRGHTIGVHDSYVIFEPKRVKILKEAVVNHYIPPAEKRDSEPSSE